MNSLCYSSIRQCTRAITVPWSIPPSGVARESSGPGGPLSYLLPVVVVGVSSRRGERRLAVILEYVPTRDTAPPLQRRARAAEHRHVVAVAPLHHAHASPSTDVPEATPQRPTCHAKDVCSLPWQPGRAASGSFRPV